MRIFFVKHKKVLFLVLLVTLILTIPLVYKKQPSLPTTPSSEEKKEKESKEEMMKRWRRMQSICLPREKQQPVQQQPNSVEISPGKLRIRPSNNIE